MSTLFEVTSVSSVPDLQENAESITDTLTANTAVSESELSESSSGSDEDEVDRFEEIGTWGTYGIEKRPWHNHYCPVIQFHKYENLKLTDLEKSGYLTDRIIASCSSYLEKNPIRRKYVICKCVLKNKNLIDISIIHYHHFLQYLDISWNLIEDLSPLSSLPFLMYLDASHNKLEKLLDFKPPYNLTFVDMSFNLITEFKDLSEFWSLKTLNLSYNFIRKIHGLSNLRYLETLNLSFNSIQCIENLDNLYIFNLYLRSNEIDRFVCNERSGFKTMPFLTNVKLSHNNLSSLKMFQGAALLHSIDLQKNNISNLIEISCVRDLKFLSDVNFKDNPIKNLDNYELVCIDTIKMLQVLDGTPVDLSLKVCAESIFNPDNNQQSARDHANILALSHLTKLTNLGLNVIPIDQPPRPLIIIVGPIAGGQESLVKQFASINWMHIFRLVCHTTRARNKDDTDSDDYFVTRDQFDKLLESGEFLMVYEEYNTSYGLTQEEFGRGVDSIGKIMVLHANLNAALALRIRGFRPVIILAMPRSEAIHRQLIADFYETCVFNIRYPEAALKVLERDDGQTEFFSSTNSSSIQITSKSDSFDIEKYLLKTDSDQKEEEDYDILNSCSAFFKNMDNEIALNNKAIKGERSTSINYFDYKTEQIRKYPVGEIGERSSTSVSDNLTEDFYKQILRTRDTFLKFHHLNTGVIYEIVYTDELDKAMSTLKHIAKRTMKAQINAKPTDDIFLSTERLTCQEVVRERLKLWDEEIDRFMKNPIPCTQHNGK